MFSSWPSKNIAGAFEKAFYTLFAEKQLSPFISNYGIVTCKLFTAAICSDYRCRFAEIMIY
jgi:hypothetical protein